MSWLVNRTDILCATSVECPAELADWLGTESLNYMTSTAVAVMIL